MTPTPHDRIAIIGIFVDRLDATPRLNAILHDYANCIVGRMGIPYPPKHLNVISLIVDATETTISSLSGKLGMLPGVRVKTLFAKSENPTP